MIVMRPQKLPPCYCGCSEKKSVDDVCCNFSDLKINDRRKSSSSRSEQGLHSVDRSKDAGSIDKSRRRHLSLVCPRVEVTPPTDDAVEALDASSYTPSPISVTRSATNTPDSSGSPDPTEEDVELSEESPIPPSSEAAQSSPVRRLRRRRNAVCEATSLGKGLRNFLVSCMLSNVSEQFEASLDLSPKRNSSEV